IKAQAAYLLGEIGNKSAAPLLREALSKRVGRTDPNEDRLMRLQINEALVKLGDDAALDELRIAIYPSKSEDLEAAVLAAQILGVLKDRASQRKLIELVETTVRTESSRASQMPPEVRLAAAGALARMGQITGAVAVADEYRLNPAPAVRAQAAVVYGDTHNRPQLGRLAGMIDDPDPAVRLAVAAAILKIIDGDPVAK
ncbi:MAG: HEAT repeat domain-containing protein, partial [Phycisphaerales bacterium]